LYPDLITSLYNVCKTWYEKGRTLERMYEDERARCALLQDQVRALEGELSSTVSEMRNVLDAISPLVTTSQNSINVWQQKVHALQDCALGITSSAGCEDEQVANTPATTAAAPVVDDTSTSILESISISSFNDTAIFGAEHANLISSRGLEFMLQWQKDGHALVDQTIHLFNVDTGNHEVKDKYARRISSGVCLLQYDLQLCPKKAFGDNSVRNFGNYTQRTNKFVLSKTVLVPKLSDTTIDELTSEKIHRSEQTQPGAKSRLRYSSVRSFRRGDRQGF